MIPGVLVSLSVTLALDLASLRPASAQTAKAAASKAKKEAAPKAEAAADADSAQRDVEAGIKSLQEGKLDAATQQLSSALATGKLPPTQMARALYYRGLAYRRQSKPAQAIADFTSALWLKNGLDANQKADALQNRAAAYREAGLSDQAEGDEKRVASTETTPSSGGRSSGSSTAVSASLASSDDASSSSNSGGIGSFFGNLFGGSSSQSASVSANDRSQAKEPAPQAAMAWSQATEVRKLEKTAAVAPAPAPVVTGSTPPSPMKPVRSSASGIYLQVATVRGLNEAQGIAAHLKQMGVSDTAGRSTEITETTIGNMGTLYRVRVGPFANHDEPQLLCVKLRSSGLDCLISPQ